MGDELATLDESAIGDNLLYYDYRIKHLLSLVKAGKGLEDESFMSAFRSFEGEVFENYAYEMLLRYARANAFIKKFVLKGPHKKRTRAQPNALSVNWRGQIVYRIKRNEIGEFDALFFTDTELYFVEMTLVGSVSNLKKRMRKKRALLQTLFPQYDVRALLILNEGVTGINTLPEYCTSWVTQPFSAQKIFERLIAPGPLKRERFRRIDGGCIVDTDSLKIRPFKYYNTLGWILNKSRHPEDVLSRRFLKSTDFCRYHDLYVKVYVGYMEADDFDHLFTDVNNPQRARIYVAIEKEHTGTFILNYFLSHSRKNLDLITEKEHAFSVAKKDPFGVTVTEISYISRVVRDEHRLSSKAIRRIRKILPTL